MKPGLHLKLAIGIIVVFGLLLTAMALWPAVQFRLNARALESEDAEERWEAFQYLCKQGEDGHKVIDNYCRKLNTKEDRHKKLGDLTFRIWMSRYVFRATPLSYDVERTDDYKFTEPVVHMAVSNSGKSALRINVNNHKGNSFFGKPYVVPHTYNQAFRFDLLLPFASDSIGIKAGERVVQKYPLWERSNIHFPSEGIYSVEILPLIRISLYHGLTPPYPLPESNRVYFAILPMDQE